MANMLHVNSGKSGIMQENSKEKINDLVICHPEMTSVNLLLYFFPAIFLACLYSCLGLFHMDDFYNSTLI